MTINPNNHARDGGRASSEMEIEAVAGIAAMFGWEQPAFLGHLTSSGTLANLEALWVAGQLAPGRRIVASEQAHYTHKRISAVLKLEFASIPADNRGRMEIDALETELRKGDVGTVVVTLGATAIGAVDPLDEILALSQKYGSRVHVDAAYGGYFRLIPEALGEPAAYSFAIRTWDASTSTIRRIPTSLQSSCTWVRSVWNAREPEPPPLPCGPRSSFSRSSLGASLPVGLPDAGRRPSSWMCCCARTLARASSR
jgi:glutamate/tyrosine decarboxylase-like PLP-dependent enzyme